MEILLGFILWLFSSLFVFYITERIKQVKNNKILFRKLYIRLKELYITLERLKSSCRQYIDITSNYSLSQIWSIWFPNYSLNTISDLIPNIAYKKENSFLYDNLIQINNIIFSLNSTLDDLFINEIKDDFLSWRLWLKESEERYKNELSFIKSIYTNIDSYLVFIFNSIILISLINKENINKVFKFKTLFSSEKLDKEKEILKKELLKFEKFEEYK